MGVGELGLFTEFLDSQRRLNDGRTFYMSTSLNHDIDIIFNCFPFLETNKGM